MGAEPLPCVGLEPTAAEEPTFLDRGDEQIYVVRHAARGAPRATAVLCGPFGLERAFAFPTWVRWARTLAARGVETWRFDVRGHGESTGSFHEASLPAWDADVALVSERARAAAPRRPLVLHGLRFGALLAARAFARGHADALLLWDPPAGAAPHLRELLRRRLAEDFAAGLAGKRSRDDLLADLERDGSLEVDGYLWSRRLWRDAQTAPLELPSADEVRPWRVVHLDRRPAARVVAPGKSEVCPVPRPPFWAADPALVVELGDLFDRSLSFFAEVSS